MSSALIFGNAPKQSVGEMLPMSSGRKVLKLARHDVQVRKFMTAPGLGPITALCFKATIRTASSDREVLAPMSDQEPGRTSIGSLPLDQWRHARVEAIEVQEVEGVIDHPFITVWLYFESSWAHHVCLRLVCSQRLSSKIVQQDTHAGQKSVHHPPSTSFAIASPAMRLRSAAFV